MAEIIRFVLLSLVMIVLISLAAADMSVQSVKCEMACALNYSQVSFLSVIIFCTFPAVVSSLSCPVCVIIEGCV